MVQFVLSVIWSMIWSIVNSLSVFNGILGCVRAKIYTNEDMSHALSEEMLKACGKLPAH